MSLCNLNWHLQFCWWHKKAYRLWSTAASSTKVKAGKSLCVCFGYHFQEQPYHFWAFSFGTRLEQVADVLRLSQKRMKLSRIKKDASLAEDETSSNCQEHSRFCCGLFRLFHTRYSLWCAAYLLRWNAFHFSSLISPAHVTLLCILYARVSSDKSLKTFQRSSTDERKRKHISQPKNIETLLLLHNRLS